jgi:Phosphotransferase enzyme family
MPERRCVRHWRPVVTDLSGCPVTVPGLAGKQDPQWHSGCVPTGDRFFVEFAWSRPAALRLAREIGVLPALGREPKVPFLPEVIASSADPLLMITRRVPGTSLFEVAGSIGPDHAARQLVQFLAALARPAARQRPEAAVGPLTGAQLPSATTRTVRERLGTWIRPDQRRTVVRWCDWADAVLGSPGPAVLVHGDLHGDNPTEGDSGALDAGSEQAQVDGPLESRRARRHAELMVDRPGVGLHRVVDK